MDKPTLMDVAIELHRQPRSVSSDFARAYSQEIGALASQGLITTRLANRNAFYGRLWRLTSNGVSHLEKTGLL